MRRLTGDEARAISPIARRMLAALGYDASRLRSSDGMATDGSGLPRQELRFFQDPRTGAEINVIDNLSQEAPGVTIKITPRRRDPMAGEELVFHYDSLRGGLISKRTTSAHDPTQVLDPPEIVATNLLTQRTFQGGSALDSMGMGMLDPPPRLSAPGPELQRMHEAIARALSAPRVAPSPGLSPTPGP